MAGIGFELRKLCHNSDGLLSSIKAYAFSSLTTIGPMVLCMTMMIGMQLLMSASGATFAERELFQATTVYCFIFSVLLTGGISMVLTRFVADKLFMKQVEHLLSSFYGALAVCLPAGAVIAWLFLHDLPAGPGYKAASYLFFMELIILWIGTVHLSALKDYKRIVRSFFIGSALSAAGSWLLLECTPYNGAGAVLTMMVAGFFTTILLMIRHFHQIFPPVDSRYYFHFIQMLRKHPSLFWIGTFLYCGVYIHSFVYWQGPLHADMLGKFAISPFYDLPVFYAYLTAVPTLVTFVVSVETSFYVPFRDYYSLVLNGGTLPEIAQAKRTMQHTVMKEIAFVMEVQLLFTVVSLAAGIKLLPMLGFTMEQLDTFTILTLGYYLFIVAFVLMLLLLYFDDRKGVLWISGSYVIMNAALTYWTMHLGRHGLGMFGASLVELVLAMLRLKLYVQNIDYYTFCSQPATTRPSMPAWRRYGRKASFSAMLLLGVSFLLSACVTQEPAEPEAPSGTVQASTADAVPAVLPVTAPGLHEDKRLYGRDDDTSVIGLYLTILPDGADSGQPITWYELNRISSRMEEGEMKAIVQEGASDGSGPVSGMFGYGTTDGNASISLRGNTARYASQRSYKVKLNDKAGLWRDQRTLNLNKSPFDPSRIRNKLSFDLFETLPDITSLRTQSVHLYVRDYSENGSAEKPFEDYGLFLNIEQPNELYLKNHWLDPYGHLYKAIMFEFHRYPDEIKLQSDPDYDKDLFESRLEVQGREDHEKLIAMLDDLNDPTIPIETVIEKHFDLNNYMTWMAANILMDNMDTITQNFLLYSPLNSSKWYFLPWDYDGAWEQPRLTGISSDYSNGISNYWSSILHNRFFRSKRNVQLLSDKVDELYGRINKDTVTERIQKYRKVVEPFLHRAPDMNFLTVEVSELDEEFKRIAETPLRSIQRFHEDLKKPKPFFLGDPEKRQDKLRFVWDLSFDLEGSRIVYDWAIAKDPAFTSIVDQRNGLEDPWLEIDALPPGGYYWKVIARNEAGERQVAFDIHFGESDVRYYGVRHLEVE